MKMKNILKCEEAALWGVSIFVFSRLDFEWWWYPLLLFLPDVSMAGYIVSARVGAAVYNFWHHRAVSVIVFLVGCFSAIPWIMLIGCILFGHIAMDRLFGYGLKLPSGFHDTHLGKIEM